ncbi:DUF2510 domain-containing protein [Streptomyces sp. NBC_00385]|uniref:DUF2510 domain-containing protein n=1 Tax=Streptomyces sp. NBC_00385 TaxID=2975733 RepID=UPI002DD83844|nr:DUF2510 domain-containing protein [Streptomyces sp. NBC_00385]WRZ07665.1 DUF2510 domain-containing protein [Streptomyces sp. NBC_00385]
MSNATPPGWYPDTAAPGNERWWDGTAWTAHTRPSATVIQRPVSGRGDGGGGASAARTVALVATGVAVVVVAVTGAMLLNRGDGPAPTTTRSDRSAPSPADTAAGASGDAGPSPEPSAAGEDPHVLVDQLNGITLPIPDGWERPENTVEQLLTMRTTGSYDCPGASSAFCYHGTVTTRTPSGTGITAPEALARQDIGAAADRAYEEDAVGRRIHGGIVSHREIAAGSVSVAGRTGYRVRWRVVTAKGPGGYVQSLVFPSAVGSESPVVVRYAFDAGPDGPPLALMDTLTQGIRPIGDSETGGGVGSSVGP